MWNWLMKNLDSDQELIEYLSGQKHNHHICLHARSCVCAHAWMHVWTHIGEYQPLTPGACEFTFLLKMRLCGKLP